MTNVRPTDAVAVVSRDERRSARYAARRTLHRETSLPRLRHCGRSLSKHGEGNDGATVSVKCSDGVAGYSGLQSCGSPWACPVCSQNIMATRAAEIEEAVRAWEALGGRVAFLTLTMRHKRGQRLGESVDETTGEIEPGLWSALSHAWGKVTSGKEWVADCEAAGTRMSRVIKSGDHKGETRWGHRIPYVRAVESTHGANGWHLHIHALMFLRGDITDAGVEALNDTVYKRWAAALQSRGLTSPTPEHGIDFKLVPRGDAMPLGTYISKSLYAERPKDSGAGWEVAGGAGKTARSKNRTPFQILADVVALGDADDLAIWHEWEAASKGKRQMTWSVGFRDFLGLGAEKTDDDAATEELGGDVVMTFTKEEWLSLYWRAERVLALVEQGVTDKRILWQILGADDSRLGAVDHAA